jgi:hypothetical protein
MSIDAAGTFRDTLVYSIWKGRNYVRSYARPTNRNSDAQKAQRNLLQSAVAGWQALYSGTQDDWNVAARDCYPPISGFNYFVSQWCLQGAAPTIPAVAPKKAKSIHKSRKMTEDTP